MDLSLQEIFDAPKTIPVPHEWTELNDRLMWISPLDIGGATISGLRIRIRTIKTEPERNVTVALEYVPVGRECGLDRIDWRPFHNHTNRGLGPPEHQFKIISTSHRHEFGWNLKGGGVSMRKGNLPIAIPIENEPVNFQELLDFVAKTYNIAALEDLRPPDWEAVLI